MGGGEYNNLGHHVYIRNEDGTYDEIGQMPEIPKFAEGGIVNNAKIPFLGHGESYEIPLKIKPKSMYKLKRSIMTGIGFTNNYLKMHGLPMFRRYGK